MDCKISNVAIWKLVSTLLPKWEKTDFRNARFAIDSLAEDRAVLEDLLELLLADDDLFPDANASA